MITTGMSAPPIGSVIVTPHQREPKNTRTAAGLEIRTTAPRRGHDWIAR
jgi:hypothetical protein